MAKNSIQIPLRGRALVVDDDEDVRELLVVLLCLAGFQVEAVADGLAGIEAARNTDYDHIFCDIRMPVLSGDNVVKTILAEKPETTIYVVTAEPDGAGARRALAMGAKGCLPKPFSVDSFWEFLGLSPDSIP